MHEHHIEDMVRRLKLKTKGRKILERYWSDKIAIVWDVEDVHKAANECEVALTNKEAVQVLQTLHDQHNAQYGIRWEDLTTHIEDNVLGRKLTKAEIKQFVEKDLITINK
jgi:hypothetical protein